MAMKVKLLAFGFMLVVATKVSSTPSAGFQGVFPPFDDPRTLPVAPKPSPMMPATPLPAPKPHIPKKCAVGCVDYCRVKLYIKSKRACQKVCSLCCQKCNVCIPKPDEEHKCNGTWNTVAYLGHEAPCP